jgi:hypothetical protein
VRKYVASKLLDSTSYLATNDVGSYHNYPRDVDVVYLGSVELRGEASCAVRGINFS